MARPGTSEAVSRSSRPRVLLVGGPDVDARLELMGRLTDAFELGAVGSEPALASRFAAEGYAYEHYDLSRRMSPVSDLLAFRQLVAIFRRRKPHIVHAFDTKPGVWAPMAARLAGVPVVLATSTGLGSLYGSDRWRIRLAWWTYVRLQTLACRMTDLMIFQNHDDARHFVAEGIVPEEKTRVVPGSGVSTARFAPESVSEGDLARLRSELGIRANGIVVTMISRVIRSKGVPEFIAAAVAVRRSHPDAQFILIGSEDQESLDRLTAPERVELGNSVTWPGPRRDVAAVLAASDVFVLPTAYREGIPRVLLEAASMGLPLVATDSPGCNEIVEDGVNGFLVPVRDAAAAADAILRLVEHPELRRQMGQRSRRQAIARFDMSAVASQIRGIYETLLAKKGAASGGCPAPPRGAG